MSTSKEGSTLLEMISLYGQIQDCTNRWPKQYEFGADWDENEALIAILKRIGKYLQVIAPHFDLATTSLANANHYFELTRLTDKLLERIQEINLKPWGTSKNTFEIKEALEPIIEQLEAIYNFLEKR